MENNDLYEDMKNQTDSTFDFEKELAAFKKRDRRKMLLAGFVAGVLLAVGVAMYKADANANSDLSSYQYSQTGNYDSGAAYADYSSQSSGGAGGGCCGTGGSSLADVSLSDLEDQALDLYKKEKSSGADVTAKAKSYGCHIQIDITDKSGKIVRSFGYRGDQIYVIS